MSRTVSKFAVRKTGRGFQLSSQLRQEPAPEHPLLIQLPAGRAFFPFSDYMHERVCYQNASPGTVEDEAYILCGWFNYLNDQGLSWLDANDAQIALYKDALLARCFGNRARRCVHVVFNFYYLAEYRLHLVSGMVGQWKPGRSRRRYPISAVLSPKGVARSRVIIENGKQGPGRPTPDRAQVDVLLDALLDRKNTERATCLWLTANLMLQSGLRCQGVAGITLTALSEALKQDGIYEASQLNARGRRQVVPYDLAALASNASAQSRIRDELSVRRRRNPRKTFGVLVREKGRSRYAQVPVTLMEQMLFYIWTRRDEIVSEMFRRRRAYKRCQHLFLSRKTGQGLKRKSIGNEINAVFNKNGIPGSAHRLRAFLAEQVVRECYLRAKAVHGSAWDQASVLLEAAERLGHLGTGSLVHYLNRAVREHDLVDGEAVLVTAPDAMAVVRALVDAINQGRGSIVEDLERFWRDYVSDLA